MAAAGVGNVTFTEDWAPEASAKAAGADLGDAIRRLRYLPPPDWHGVDVVHAVLKTARGGEVISRRSCVVRVAAVDDAPRIEADALVATRGATRLGDALHVVDVDGGGLLRVSLTPRFGALALRRPSLYGVSAEKAGAGLIVTGAADRLRVALPRVEYSHADARGGRAENPSAPQDASLPKSRLQDASLPTPQKDHPRRWTTASDAIDVEAVDAPGGLGDAATLAVARPGPENAAPSLTLSRSSVASDEGSVAALPPATVHDAEAAAFEAPLDVTVRASSGILTLAEAVPGVELLEADGPVLRFAAPPAAATAALARLTLAHQAGWCGVDVVSYDVGDRGTGAGADILAPTVAAASPDPLALRGSLQEHRTLQKE